MEKEPTFYPSAESSEKAGEGEGGQSAFERKLDRLEAELKNDPVWQKIVDLLRSFPTKEPPPGFLERLNQRIDAYQQREAKRRERTKN